MMYPLDHARQCNRSSEQPITTIQISFQLARLRLCLVAEKVDKRKRGERERESCGSLLFRYLVANRKLQREVIERNLSLTTLTFSLPQRQQFSEWKRKKMLKKKNWCAIKSYPSQKRKVFLTTFSLIFFRLRIIPVKQGKSFFEQLSP